LSDTTDKSKENSTNDPRLVSLLLDASAGDGNAFETLAKDYAPLLESCVATYYGRLPDADIDELKQEALLAFLRAVRRYDPLYGDVSFGLYAKICVRNGVSSAVRSILSSDTQSTLPIDDFETDDIPSPQDEVIERENAEELRRMIRGLLSDYENTVWWSYYSGVPVRKIAEQLNKSPRSVENALIRIRRKLREALR